MSKGGWTKLTAGRYLYRPGLHEAEVYRGTRMERTYWFAKVDGRTVEFADNRKQRYWVRLIDAQIDMENFIADMLRAANGDATQGTDAKFRLSEGKGGAS